MGKSKVSGSILFSPCLRINIWTIGAEKIKERVRVQPTETEARVHRNSDKYDGRCKGNPVPERIG